MDGQKYLESMLTLQSIASRNIRYWLVRQNKSIMIEIQQSSLLFPDMSNREDICMHA